MAKGFIAKILLGLLVLSFGFWGIGDIVRNKSGAQTSVAEIDGKPIPVSELNQLIAMLQRNYPQITAEVASDSSFKLQALNNLINSRLIEAHAHEMGMAFSQETLAKMIHDDAAFKAEDGSFDRARFLSVLQQNNLNEQSYLQRLRDDTGASLIDETLRMGFAPSSQMLSLAYAINNEEREAKLVFISKDDLPPIAKPKEAELKTLYKHNSPRFTAPEYRSMRYITFSPDDAWKLLKLDPKESELKAMYEEHKAAYATEERRNVSQLLFEDKASAKKIYQKLQAGTEWNALPAALATSLGSVTRSALPPAAAEAVFALKEKAYTGPIKTAFGWNIFYVSSISPSKSQSFDDVKKRLLADYKAEHMETKVSDLANQLEDALAGGESLKSALKSLGLESLTIHTTNALSQDGISKDGTPANSDPLLAAVLKEGFTLDQGETSSLLLTENNEYYLVQVKDIIPSRLKSMEKVNSQLNALYKAQAQEKSLKAKAESIAKTLKESENPVAVAEKEKLALHASGKLKRMHDTVQNNEVLKNKILTSGFVMELFRLKLHEVTTPYPLPSGDYAIGILTDIHPASAPSEDAMRELDLKASQEMGNDILYHYFRDLRARHKVEVHAEQLMGNATQEDAAR